MDKRWFSKTCIAVLFVGAVAVVAARLSGLGAAVGLPVFLGLQQFAMARAREAPMWTRRVYGAAAAAAALGLVVQYAIA